MAKDGQYVPALGWWRLALLYDPLMRRAVGEAEFKRRLLERAAVAPGERVLDLGCGTATLTLLLKQREPAAEIVGLDGDRAMLRIARAKADAARKEVRLIKAMSFDLSFSDCSCDRIVSSLRFHHAARETHLRRHGRQPRRRALLAARRNGIHQRGGVEPAKHRRRRLDHLSSLRPDQDAREKGSEKMRNNPMQVIQMQRATAAAGLLALLLLGSASLSAQEQSGAAQDSFAEINEHLGRSAERELEFACAMPPADPIQPGESRAGQDVRRSSDSLEPASLPAVGRASRRLATLGVDAAGIFTQEGVPLELLVVAQAESDFDPAALSSRGARGLWQLMPATARELGLQVSSHADERSRLQPSTVAAARYLRQLHAKFGDWLLALAAYNAGEGRVAAAIAQAQTHDFWDLAQQGLLPNETRRYVLDVLRRLHR